MPSYISQTHVQKTKINYLKISNMKTKIFSFLMVAVFVISTAASAQQTRGEYNKGKRQEMMKPGMRQNAQKSNFLTEEQKETMGKLRLETAKALKPLKNELRELQARQQTLTTANNADLKAIDKNIDKMAEVKAEMAKIMAKQHQAFRSQLTEEQLIKFDSRKNKMRQGMRNQDGRNRADGPRAQRHGWGA
jgi:Spy/CpxP family protein refolding chaperone